MENILIIDTDFEQRNLSFKGPTHTTKILQGLKTATFNVFFPNVLNAKVTQFIKSELHT